MNNPEWAVLRSAASRAFILERHTWSHRVVEILDFYYNIKNKYKNKNDHRFNSLHYNDNQKDEMNYNHDTNNYDIIENNLHADIPTPVCGQNSCNRPNCPKLLWIVSEDLEFHSDVIFVVEKIGFETLCRSYDIEYMNEDHHKWQLLQLAANRDFDKSNVNYDKYNKNKYDTNNLNRTCQNANTNCEELNDNNGSLLSSLQWIGRYDVLMAVVVPFDRVDRTIR
jgi:hypothetical protein